MVLVVHPPFLTCMELSTAKSVGRLLDIRTGHQMHLVKQVNHQLTPPMLMASVSLMAEIHASTSGLLQQPSMHEVGDRYPSLNCPCTNRDLSSSATPPPSFVGNDYFCDTGSAEPFQHIFYGDDPLWDGAGCGPLNDCCILNIPPWFRNQLPSATTDNIEMRFCRGAAPDEDTPVEIIEIYVQ